MRFVLIKHYNDSLIKATTVHLIYSLILIHDRGTMKVSQWGLCKSFSSKCKIIENAFQQSFGVIPSVNDSIVLPKERMGK